MHRRSTAKVQAVAGVRTLLCIGQTLCCVSLGKLLTPSELLSNDASNTFNLLQASKYS